MVDPFFLLAPWVGSMAGVEELDVDRGISPHAAQVTRTLLCKLVTALARRNKCSAAARTNVCICDGVAMRERERTINCGDHWPGTDPVSFQVFTRCRCDTPQQPLSLPLSITTTTWCTTQSIMDQKLDSEYSKMLLTPAPLVLSC